LALRAEVGNGSEVLLFGPKGGGGDRENIGKSFRESDGNGGKSVAFRWQGSKAGGEVLFNVLVRIQGLPPQEGRTPYVKTRH